MLQHSNTSVTGTFVANFLVFILRVRRRMDRPTRRRHALSAYSIILSENFCVGCLTILWFVSCAKKFHYPKSPHIMESNRIMTAQCLEARL